MNDFVKEALEIVKAQASVRAMTEEEIVAMVKKVAASLEAMTGPDPACDPTPDPAVDPKTSIKEGSITCLECGKRFKIITKKHLAAHGLTPADYRAKYGMKKAQPLACKSLARERRKTMNAQRLWERSPNANKPSAPAVQ